MKVHNPGTHTGPAIISPGVAPNMKPNAGAGVVPPKPDDNGDTTPGASPSPLGALELELETMLETWLPRLDGLLATLRTQPYATRLENMVLVLARRENIDPADLVHVAAVLLATIDTRVDALTRADRTTPAPDSGPDGDDEDELDHLGNEQS